MDRLPWRENCSLLPANLDSERISSVEDGRSLGSSHVSAHCSAGTAGPSCRGYLFAAGLFSGAVALLVCAAWLGLPAQRGLLLAAAKAGGVTRGLLDSKPPCRVQERLLSDRVLSDGPCSGPPEPPQPPAATWEVVFNGSVNVRELQDLSSNILDVKWKCDQVNGHQEGQWVKLHNQPGYMRITLGGFTLLKPVTVYEKITTGHCVDIGKYAITEAGECTAAAWALGLNATLAPAPEGSPAGCYLQARASLLLGTGSDTKGLFASDDLETICFSHDSTAPEPCQVFVTTTVTTATSTTSTTTWGWPSLYCFCVIRAEGEQPRLVQAQQQRGVGVFGCDEHDVFSHGGAAELGNGLLATEVELEQGHPNTFQQAWLKVRSQRKYTRHDWTVKVDPDTVFFPHRLRGHVERHTTEQGQSKFIVNCLSKDSKSKLAASMEVFSRQAISTYLWNGKSCMRTLNAISKGWAEESFMQECLEMLGSSPVHDFDMLSDKGCLVAPCTDTTKVAFHDFGDVDTYVKCLEESMTP